MEQFFKKKNPIGNLHFMFMEQFFFLVFFKSTVLFQEKNCSFFTKRTVLLVFIVWNCSFLYNILWNSSFS